MSSAGAPETYLVWDLKGTRGMVYGTILIINTLLRRYSSVDLSI